MLELVLHAAAYGVEHFAEPAAVAVVSSVATAKAMKWRGADREMREHDRRAGEIAEDLWRWMRDRDHAAKVRLNEIRQDAARRNVTSTGLLAMSAGKVYRRVLHEYRDRASVARRELEAHAAEKSDGIIHRRQRSGPAFATLPLPDDCRLILAAWRDCAEEDPSRPELEPRLAEIAHNRHAA